MNTYPQSYVNLPKKEDNKYYVYFISDDHGHCKIGITNNMRSRIKNLQNGCPYELDVVKIAIVENETVARAVEDYWHYVFKDKHIRGEWFKLTKREIYNVHTEEEELIYYK